VAIPIVFDPLYCQMLAPWAFKGAPAYFGPLFSRRRVTAVRKILFVFATLAALDVANAQPYTVPYYAPSAVPNYVPPAPPSNYALPGYDWREQRGDTDWRNNTWREDRFDTDWRNNNWQTRRELRDWRQREDYSKIRTPNNAADQGYVECGEGSVGSSSPCGGYSTNKKREIIDGYERAPVDAYGKATGANRLRIVARGVENCGHLSVWRRC
jgi:hypothetical protein